MEPSPPDPANDQPAPGRRSVVARAKFEKERVTARVTSARDQLEGARERSTTVDAALRAIEHDAEIGGGVLAAAVGFRVFLFLVPYVFVWIAGFGVASSAAGESPGEAARNAGIGGLIARSLGDFGSFGTGQRILALVVGFFALALASRALVKTLAVVSVLVWRNVQRRKVSSSKGAGLLVLLATVAMLLSSIVSWLRGESFIAGLFGIVLFMAVPFGLWLLVSWLLPHPAALPWWALLPGAALMAVGVEILHVVTIVWISRSISAKSDTYGAIGGALSLLLWAYLLGRLVVAATVANAALWRRNAAREATRVDPLS